jgi:hypothetical protein
LQNKYIALTSATYVNVASIASGLTYIVQKLAIAHFARYLFKCSYLIYKFKKK